MKPPSKNDGPKPPRRKLSFPTIKRISLPWLLVLLLVGFSVFMLLQYRQASDKLQPTPTNSTKQVNDVVSRVGKLIILPKNETPTIVTVKDAAKLKSEQFYANAQNGDITLVYSKEKKAVLYRPSANIIVNVATVTVAPATP